MELYAPDSARAREFYASVFGFTYEDTSDGDFDYATFHVDGEARGGVAGAGSGPSPRWATYFAVVDADAAVDRVEVLGGRMLRGPEESPYGRVAAVPDPQGTPFNLIAAVREPN